MTEAPIPMLLFCPVCNRQHIDKPDSARGWTNPPHRSHECQNPACGTIVDGKRRPTIWRPADVATTGVEAIETRGRADTWDGRASPVQRPAGSRHAIDPNQMPAPDAIVDYGNGHFAPAMMHYAHPDHLVADLAREAGFECLVLPIDEDLGSDHQLVVDYQEYGVEASEILPQWTPSEPGDGWVLSAKYENEDGPAALFLRPLKPAEAQR